MFLRPLPKNENPPSTDTEPLAQSACLLAAVSYRSKRSCRQPLYQYIILLEPSLAQNRSPANWYLLRYKRQHASPAPPPPPPPTSIGFAKCVQVRLAARRAYCMKISPGTFLKLSHDSINETKVYKVLISILWEGYDWIQVKKNGLRRRK